MKETTELSPKAENGKETQKSFDVSKIENGFVFVPIDRRLLEAKLGFLTASQRTKGMDGFGEDFNLLEEIHSDLLECVKNDLEFHNCEDYRRFENIGDWYPDRSMFDRFPSVDNLEPNPIPTLQKTDDDFQCEHEEWEKKTKEEIEKTDYRVVFEYHKRFANKKPEMDALYKETHTRVREILGLPDKK